MSQTKAPEAKLIRHNTGRVDLPDDPSYPFKLEVSLDPPKLMEDEFVKFFGGSEEIVLRGMTKEALDKLVEAGEIRTNSRLRHFIITGPDGVVERFQQY